MGNLTDRGTLRGSLKENTTDYNALINKPAINGHTLVGNKTGHELDLANREDIINVEANPEGTSSGDLKRILIGTNIYEIPGVVVYGEASGAIASFDDGGDNKPLKSLKVAINPVQSGSGDPSPQNVRPISGWTGANVNNYKVYQICESTDNSYTSNGLTITYEGIGKYSVRGRMASNASTTLTMNFTEFNIYDGEDSYIALNNTFSLTNLNLYLRYGTTNIEQWGFTTNYRILSYTGMRGKAINNLTLVVPNALYGTDIDFTFKIELYSNNNKHTYPITWSEAGEVYGGELDVKNGVLRVNRKLVDLGSMTYAKSSSKTDCFASTRNVPEDLPLIPSTTTILKGICSQYKPTSVSAISSKDCAITYRENFSYNGIMVKDSTYHQYYVDNDTQAFQQAMDGVQLVYELATPQEIQLTPTEVATLLGNNNLWSDTGDVIECIYERDLNIAINKLIAG